MLRSVRVTRVGDTDFPVDEQVDRFRLMEENEKVMNRGGEPADGTPLLLGITNASARGPGGSLGNREPATFLLRVDSYSMRRSALLRLHDGVIAPQLYWDGRRP
jgi:hypothetical protein